MKSMAKVIGLVSLFCAIIWVPTDSRAASLGAMRVGLAEGDVQVKISETGEWAPVAVNTPLLEGDEIWVPDGSRAALQTNNGADIRLDGGTAFQLLRMDRDSYQFHVTEGYVYVLNRSPERTVLQFDTPDASIRSFGRSTFRIDIPGGETDISVTNGSVTAETADGTTRVRAGDMLALGPGGLDELSPLPKPDEWQVWNERRDRAVLVRRGSDRYLPDELRVYSDDFETNGRWVNVREYGYVWTPTVVVAGDWAPYRHGRWVWRGGEYVWIGYEPWGWAPYHYGRWAFEVRIGWFWVPPERGNVHWGPGYVGWVRTADHVAWVPLAPREIYYGHGDYGRHSMNITNVNINQVRVTNVYRNVNVTNSITVVNQTTFVTGRPAPVQQNVVVNVREDFAQRRNIVVGRPQIKPVETSYIPVVRSIPESKRPPERIRKIEVRQLQKARPLVKEADRSVIRTEEKPKPMQVRKVEAPRPVQERAKVRQPGQPAVIRGEKPSAAPPPGKPEKEGKESAPKGGAVDRGERGAKPVVVPPAERPTPEKARPKEPPRAAPQASPGLKKEQPERSREKGKGMETEKAKAKEKAKEKAEEKAKEKAKEAEEEEERGGERRDRR
ncbi:MAG TPA: hypothetical protein DDX05_04790 [Deltaproteobacteria bacterium]|nr:hypothetical protein [Deltaproteobacteria bacterium]